LLKYEYKLENEAVWYNAIMHDERRLVPVVASLQLVVPPQSIHSPSDCEWTDLESKRS
jgi:hypothetical protein